MQTNNAQIYAQSQFSAIAVNAPSICIPRVFSNISDETIQKTFDALCLGEIAQIKRIPTKEDKFKSIRITFKQWYSNPNAIISRERLLQGKEIKVIYDEPWFWKVYAYKQPSKNKEKKTNEAEDISAKMSALSVSAAPFVPSKPSIAPSLPVAQALSVSATPFVPSKPSNAQALSVSAKPFRPSTSRKYEPRTPSNSPPRKRTEKEDEHDLHNIYNEEIKNDECYVEVDYGDLKVPPPMKLGLLYNKKK